MFKRLCLTAFALLALTLMQRPVSAKILSIGDPVPAISVKRFVKGTPVTKFEKGKLYVVEFWATWCGPCKESIPHLTEMAKKFKDVTFIGVSVWEQSQEKVEPFVTSMGSKMDYHVAMDVVPAGKDGNAGAMATNWMSAAKQNGIPTAFIVGKDSTLQWIGHPMEMEEPLTKVVAGKWDIKTAQAELAEKQAATAREEALQPALQALGSKIQPLMQKKDFAGALDATDKAIAQTPALETLDQVWQFKLDLLSNLNKDPEAAAFAGKLVDGVLHNNAANLNALAWHVVNPQNPKKGSPPMIDVAVKAAARADELLKGEDAAVADTLANAYFAAGNKALAVTTEQRAIKNCKDAAMGAELKTSLAKFQK